MIKLPCFFFTRPFAHAIRGAGITGFGLTFYVKILNIKSNAEAARSASTAMKNRS